MTKSIGSTQRKPRKWKGNGRDKNHALASFRKWKKIEKAKKQADLDRYNELCGPVTVTYINK